MEGNENIENVVNPDILNKNLKIVSLYIAIYESFKDTIISNVKYFYWSGVKDGKEIFSGYEEKVLSKVTGKKNKVLRATLKWFLDLEAITEEDCEMFEKITDMRNKIVHEMAEAVFSGIDNEVIELFDIMISLYEKIEKWWVREIEIPISDNFTEEQYENIDWDNVCSMRLHMLKIMSDVAINNNYEYLKVYTEIKNEII